MANLSLGIEPVVGCDRGLTLSSLKREINRKNAGNSQVRTSHRVQGCTGPWKLLEASFLNSFRTQSLICVSPCVFALFQGRIQYFL